MKFWKRQLKKSNRGLILALILIIGVTIYTLIDNNSFKKEKPEIEELISSYIKEMGDYAVTPEEFTKTTEISDKEFKPYQDEYNKFINNYWVYKKRNPNSLYWECLMTDAKDMYSDLMNNTKENHVISAVYDARDIKIRKAGPNCATATFKVYIVAETVGDPNIITPMYPESLGWYSDEGDLTKKNKLRLEGEYEATLERTADGWRFYDSGGYITSVEEIDIGE